MVSKVIPVEPFDLVVFGATGDLARNKIMPALFRRFRAGQIPHDSRIIGTSRAEVSCTRFRADSAAALTLSDPGVANDPALAAFLSMLDFQRVDGAGEAGWRVLRERFQQTNTQRVQAFYLSVAPSLFQPIAERLQGWSLVRSATRVVVEKPFGHDLASAQALNSALRAVLAEDQIYRIDHYLGKETVQNLMAVRFANVLFEPLWNSHYIDHIQITVAESAGIGDRGGYYDNSGAMRDMVQNHIVQLLCLIAMEPPAQFTPGTVRDEKLKVLQALAPVRMHQVVRGQYAARGAITSYHQDAANPSSTVESFVALKAHVNNWRWAGTPFYLRTGKRMKARCSEINVIFKRPPHSIFRMIHEQVPNVLTIRLQPDEGIKLEMTIKEPGPGGMRFVEVPLDMSFAKALGPKANDIPDAYERLLMDVIRGDQTLFMRGDEVEAAWRWADPVITTWEERGDLPKPYESGSPGPEDALMLLHRDNRRWREISA